MATNNAIIHSFIHRLLHSKVSRDLPVVPPKSLYQRVVYSTAPVGPAKKGSVLLSNLEDPVLAYK